MRQLRICSFGLNNTAMEKVRFSSLQSTRCEIEIHFDYTRHHIWHRLIQYATKLKVPHSCPCQGYSVIFCDPGVSGSTISSSHQTWEFDSLHNPGQTVDILIQTDARDLEKPLGSLNSGLYAVKTNVTTLHAFSQIVDAEIKIIGATTLQANSLLFKIGYHSCAYVARIGSQNLSAQIDSLPVKSFQMVASGSMARHSLILALGTSRVFLRRN